MYNTTIAKYNPCLYEMIIQEKFYGHTTFKTPVKSETVCLPWLSVGTTIFNGNTTKEIHTASVDSLICLLLPFFCHQQMSFVWYHVRRFHLKSKYAQNSDNSTQLWADEVINLFAFRMVRITWSSSKLNTKTNDDWAFASFPALFSKSTEGPYLHKRIFRQQIGGATAN